LTAETPSRPATGLLDARAALPKYRRRRAAVLMATAALIGYVVLIAAAKPLLSVKTNIVRADVIVVLGGDAPVRATEAAALFKDGVAPRVLVTGDGDCQDNRDVLLQAGVPDAAIGVECLSRNTMQNSRFSAAIMRAGQVHHALIVTSWYHTRRALNCFREVAPDIEFSAVSAGAEDSLFSHMVGLDGYRTITEYLKVPWYALHYGVGP